jgi:hypothetical protein
MSNLIGIGSLVNSRQWVEDFRADRRRVPPPDDWKVTTWYVHEGTTFIVLARDGHPYDTIVVDSDTFADEWVTVGHA